MKENNTLFDEVHLWKNQKKKLKIIEKLDISSEQRDFLLNGKNNRYLGEHFLGIKGKEIFLFNKKYKSYLKEHMGDYLYLETNIYQYTRLKDAKKLGIKSGILLYGEKFYPIDDIVATKSGNMKIPVDDFIIEHNQDIGLELTEYVEEREQHEEKIKEMEKLFEKGNKIDFFGWYLDEWERCPYRLIKSIKENVSPYDEYMDSTFIKEVLVKRGLDFEKEKLSEIKWEKTKKSISELVEEQCSIRKPYIEIHGDKIGFEIPLFFKKVLFKGTPEMICLYNDKMVPLDVKSHKEITLLDEERICYYSFLMKAAFNIEPTSGLIWTKNGIVEVEISDYILRRVFEKIQRIWHYSNSNEMPLQQRTNQCLVCKLDKSCVEDLRHRGDLTLIHGVGPKIADKMKKVGINNIHDLLSQCNFSNHKLQAKAMVEERIIKLNDMEKIHGDIIYVDTETTLGGGMVWLIGFSYNGTFFQFYADNEDEEKIIVKKFLDFLKTLKNPVLVEYSETHFDYRNLMDAAKRNRLDTKFFSTIKHIDLYWVLKKSYLFPTLTRQLKDIGSYLNYPSKTNLDGPTVALGYGKHLETGEKIPEEYMLYNKDDVLMLPFILGKLKSVK